MAATTGPANEFALCSVNTGKRRLEQTRGPVLPLGIISAVSESESCPDPKPHCERASPSRESDSTPDIRCARASARLRPATGSSSAGWTAAGPAYPRESTPRARSTTRRRFPRAGSRWEPSSTSSPPSWIVTVTVSAITSDSIRQIGRSAAPSPPTSGTSGGVVLKIGAGTSPGPPAGGTTGRTSLDGVARPRCKSNVAAYGDGQMTGHAADATDTRIRCPRRKR